MRYYRLRLCTLILVMGCFPTSVFSQSAVQVIVLPFEIYAKEDLSYLQKEIPELIKRQLKQDGAVMVEPPIAEDVLWRQKIKDTEDIRSLGMRYGSDYVVWGSLTRIGEKFSLDAKMIESFGERAPDVFFIEGEGIETLISTVKELSLNFGMKLFKKERIAKIVISGNRRIEADAIKKRINTAPGDILVAKNQHTVLFQPIFDCFDRGLVRELPQ